MFGQPAKVASIRWFYRFVQTLVFVFYRIVFRVEIDGLENLPAEGGVVIAPNHASFLDPPLIGCIIPREMTYFAKKELFSVPFVSWFISYANSIPVDRGGYSAGALREFVRRLKGGMVSIIFPEGTRTKTGEFLEPKQGVGMAAVMADVPILPTWIEGSYKAKPFRTKIRVHFMPPVNPSDVPAENRKEQYLLVSKRIMYDIINLSKKGMAPRGGAAS